MTKFAALLPLLSACKPPSIAGPDTGVEHVPGVDSPASDDSDEPEEPEEPEEKPAIFDDTVIHQIEITLPDASVDGLNDDPYGWVPADVVIDGEAVSNIAVRLRGKIGSFRTLSGKPKFKLDFGEFEEGQKFQGLKHLSLNNSVVDCSYIKETAGYAVIAALGYPASYTSYSEVSVNGQPYGLYVLVEVPDDEYLERNFPEPDGNLYDGKYLWYGDWNYALTDFTPEQEDNFELEEGEDVGGADIHAITEAVRADGSFDERFGPLIDLHELHRFWLLEQWIGHIDGYALNTNNYRVFFRPEDGRAVFIHWDLDYAFLPAREWGFSWGSPKGVLTDACWDDPGCLDGQRETLAGMQLDVDTLVAQVEGWTALIAESAANDPRRECAASDIAPEQADVLGWLRVSQRRIEDAWLE